MKKNLLMFSVIVPIYKVEKYLKKCIDSILSQTYKNFELILVDDGSPDGCPQICDQYAKRDSCIKVIHKKNGGLVSARKIGLSVAQGKYILCVDGDDWIHKDYLLKFEEIIKKYNCDIVCCGSFLAFENENISKPISKEDKYYDRKRLENEIFPILLEDEKGKYFTPTLWAKVFKKNIYETQQEKIDSKINIGEDHACTKPMIYTSNSMVILKECLYYYRQNPTGMTKKPKPFLWDGPKLIGRHMERQIPMNMFDFKDQVYRMTVHNVFNVAVSQFNQDKSYKNIEEEIIKNLEDEYYQKAIKNCKYKLFSKGTLALFALKYKCVRLMWFYNKRKRG